MNALRVLGIVRPDAGRQPGGDVVHARRAAAALRDRGIAFDLLACAEPDARGYDIAHLFGIFEPETAHRQIAALKAASVPLALSPIWLDLRPLMTEAPRLERALAERDETAVESAFTRQREGRKRWSLAGRRDARAAERRLELQRELVAAADVLIPASETEARLYVERLGAAGIPSVVAPLGIEPAAFAGGSDDAPHPRNGVLCAGRIERKKNQAALLYALRDLDVKVTLAGRAHDPGYLALCRRWATPRTRFIEHLPQPELFRLMRSAAVHAHPSWLETPGLSSLEAAAAGAQIVVGDLGCEREYFGPHAFYANPADPRSIREAVTSALERGRDSLDAFEVRLRTFTWERHAEATLEAYRLAAEAA